MAHRNTRGSDFDTESKEVFESKHRHGTRTPNLAPAIEVPLPLEFITLTERPATQQSDFSYIVRSHAMQSYLQRRKSPPHDNEESASSTAPKPESKSEQELSGKFKLSTWSRKKPRRRSPGGRIARETEVTQDDPSALRAEDLAILLFSASGQSLEVDRSNAYTALPITMGIRTQSLFYHYNTGFVCNAFAINFDDAWKPFSISDSVLLHATLSMVAQHENLIRGLEDSSDDLYHKGQALKLINTRLLDDRYKMTDANITSISIFVLLETMTGTFEAATAHQVGLMRMVDLRGGACELIHNPILLRALSWGDILYSTRWSSPLKFPTFYPPDISLVATLSRQLNLSPSTTQDQFSHFSDPNTSDIFQAVQIISAAMDLPHLDVSDKKVISESLYTAEHRLLSLEHNQTNVNSNSSSMSPLTHAFIIANILYLQLIIREVPPVSRVHNRLLSKLQVFFSELDRGLFDYSALECRDVVLWIAFVKALAALNGGVKERVWEGIGKEEVWMRLGTVAWRARKCYPAFERIWDRFADGN